MSDSKDFLPEFYLKSPSDGSFRRILSLKATSPDLRYFRFIKKSLNLDDERFSSFAFDLGLEMISLKDQDAPSGLFNTRAASSDIYSRMESSFVGDQDQMIKLLKNQVYDIADEVLKIDDQSLLAELVKGLDDRKYTVRDNKKLWFTTDSGVKAVVDWSYYGNVAVFDEISRTITVQVGAKWNFVQSYLFHATDLGASRKYRIGVDMPEDDLLVDILSDEFSAKMIEPYIVGVEYVTAKGIKAVTYPPFKRIKAFDDGVGILSTVTLKFGYYTPKKYFAYIFKDFKTASVATRAICQDQFSAPALRILDADQTEWFLATSDKFAFVDKLLNVSGYKYGKRCLVVGYADGRRKYIKNTLKSSAATCKRYGGINLFSLTSKYYFRGEHNQDDAFVDYGIFTECDYKWLSWRELEEYSKSERSFARVEFLPVSSDGVVIFTTRYNVFSDKQ